MRFDVSATESAAAAFLKVAAAAEKLQEKLKELDRTKVEIKPKFDGSEVTAGLAEMRRKVREATKNLPKAKLEVSVTGLADAEQKVERLRAKMAQLGDASAKVDVNIGGSATRLNLLAQKMRDLKKLSPLKLKVEVDDQATAQLEAITALATGLAAMEPTVRVDVDSTAALAQIAALAAALEALGATANTVNINLNTRTFLGELARIRQELNAIAGGRITVDVETDQAMRELAELRLRLAELGRQEQTAVVRADTELAQHQIRQLEERLADIARNSTTARVKVETDRSWSDAAIKVAALAKALALLSIPVALAGAVPLVAALGGAALSASGAVGLLPAGLLAAGAAAAGLKVGLSGVSDAFKELSATKFDPKKFAEALSKLAPAAREFVVAVKDIGPAWNSVKLDTQQKLFAGLGAEVQKLSGAYLPTMKTGLGSIATEFNLLGKDFNTFASSTRTIENVDAIFRNTSAAMQAARPAAQNLAGAFLDIAVVGSELMPELAAGLTAATGRFRTFIDQARRSGELKVWIQDGINTLKTLGSIAGNVGGTLGAVFSAQKAAGMSLLDTLDKITAGMERWAKSAQGQSQMTAIFNEIRRTIDSLLPGLQALGQAAVDFLVAFANTGALTSFGSAITGVAQAIAPLGAVLGELVGGALSTLSDALSAAAAVAAPIISAFSGLMGVLGPIPGAVLAVVVAFKGLSIVNGMITGLGTSLAGFATRLGASATVASGLARTFSVVGTAAQGLGVALVIAAAAWDAITVSASEAARAMDAGGQAAQEAAAGLAAQTVAMDGLKNSTGGMGDVLRVVGNVMDFFTDSTEEARASMTPLQQAQLDAATAANVHALAVEQFGARSPQARAAAEALATANDKVAAGQDKAASAAMSHADQIRGLSDAMQSQIGSALAYEQAIARTAEAHKRAGAALKENGAKSDEYKSAVLNLAQAQESQAQAAQRQVEAAAASVGATNAAELGLKAYNTELLRLNDGSQQGQAAFMKIAGALSTTQLGMLSATAAASGLKTEILTLPDGRTVTVVTAADTAALEQVKVDLDAVVNSPWVGTVTVVGDPTRVNDTLVQTVANINGQQGTITLNGNNQPVQATLGQSKYNIDATTGTLTIDGNPAPGEANLTGLKLRIDSTTGTITIEGNPAPVDAAKTQAEQPSQSEHTITPNTGLTDAAKTGVQTPTGNPHTVGEPVTDNTTGPKAGAAAPTGNPHTVGAPVTDNTTGPKATAAAPTGNPHTVGSPVDAGPVDAAKAAAQQPTRSLHTFDINDDAVRDAKQRAEQPTRSLHTFDVNDNAVTDAKRRAQQPTSSRHTIFVTVVGGAPRAMGAYATPRAQGAYAAPMANGGMRRMSAARAEIVPPRQPRIIGDRMKGDEAFIPINQAPLSKAILNTTAQRMGYNLVPQNGQAMPASGAASSVSLSSIRSAINQRAAGGGGALVSAVQQLSGQLRALRGDVDHHGDNQAIVQELRALRSLLAQGGAGGSAAARAQTSRTLSELGAF
jgi:trimeric autotransporter adhesin